MPIKNEIKNCKLEICGKPFSPGHGNDIYCCREHQEEAKKERQKKKRDPIKDFIPIMMNNHEIIETIEKDGKTEISKEELQAYGIDISLCRHLQPPPEYQGKLMLDFGVYYLITEINFLTFKICKHDAVTAL